MQTSKLYFLFPSRYCTTVHSYQVPLLSANPLTKHSLQFNQDNTARWMAPAPWVFLGPRQRGNVVFLNKKYSHLPSQAWPGRCCVDRTWAQSLIRRGGRLQVISLCCGPRHELCETVRCVRLLWCSVHKWLPESCLYQATMYKDLQV